MKVDCHSHTLFSDGTLTPTALLDLAKEKQLDGISITDHDTLSAYETAIPYAKSLGMMLIPGIEISTEYQKVNVHVLGYALDLQHPSLPAFCALLQERRYARNTVMIEKFNRYGIPISLEALQQRFSKDTVLGRTHIAIWLHENGFVSSPQQAFTRYIGEKCRCYAPGNHLDTLSAITFLHAIGAVAVLAHPRYLPARIIPALSEMPWDGIEAYAGRTSLAQAKPWCDLAEKKGWFVTGGSDFHSPQKTYQPLGCSWTPPETVARLFNASSGDRENK